MRNLIFYPWPEALHGLPIGKVYINNILLQFYIIIGKIIDFFK